MMIFLDMFLTVDGLVSSLEAIDKQYLLAMNGSGSLYLDRVARTLTTAFTWVPFYISLFYIVLKNSENFQKVLFILGAAGLCVVLAGNVDDLIVKPLVARWRPAHDPEIGVLVDVVDGYRGGKYGFFSAHASNTFSIAVLFCWLVRSRILSLAMVIWSLTNCWTRVYLGVHYPGDILVGLTWGLLVGSGVYFLFCRLTRHHNLERKYVSSQYTSTGFERHDADIPVAVLILTLLYVLIKACII